MSLIFATIPPKRLAQSITSGSTAFYLNNILSFDGLTDVVAGDLGTQHYCCFRNDTGTRIEIMEIDPTTISSGPITIVRRGLSYYGDRTTEDTDLKLDWSANETIVQLGTDVPQIFQWLKEYIDSAAAAGAVPASTSAAGIVVEATQAQVDARTPTTTISSTAYKNFAPLDKIRATKYHDYVADAGSNDTYAITITPAPTAYATGQEFTFKANTINTGACTLNVNSLGAKTIKKQYDVDLDTGDIKAGQIVKVVYNGTNMEMVSPVGTTTNPVIRTYTAITPDGATTTRFDITNPAGTTFRYTFDGTGTDPGITALTYPIGTVVDVQGANFNAANKGLFIVTGSGANYFEVTNASGVAENDKTLAAGYIARGYTWTKPAGLKYIKLKMQGAGGAGRGIAANANPQSGGGAGAYLEKMFAVSALSATEPLVVGYPGVGANNADGTVGRRSIFKSETYISGGGGGGSSGSNGGGSGGTATGGDLNIKGQDGFPPSGSSGPSGKGGDSHLGHGGQARESDSAGADGVGYGGGGSGAAGDASSPAAAGGAGAVGLVIIEEYYI